MKSSFKWTFGKNCIMFLTLWDLWKYTFAMLWLSLKLVNLLCFPLVTLLVPHPAPPTHLKEPILKLQTMYRWDIRAMNHFLASSIFGQICFTKSLSVPESGLGFEDLRWNESFHTCDLTTRLFSYRNKNTFLFHSGNTHIYLSLTPKSFSKSIY